MFNHIFSHYCITQLVLYDNEKKGEQIMILIIFSDEGHSVHKNEGAQKTSKKRCQVHFQAKTTQILT